MYLTLILRLVEHVAVSHARQHTTSNEYPRGTIYSRKGAHTTKNVFLEISLGDLSMDASLDVCGLPVVENTTLESRPRRCVYTFACFTGGGQAENRKPTFRPPSLAAVFASLVPISLPGCVHA